MLARLATRQSGVVARWQLEALGLTRNKIAHRVSTGRLIRIHQGVYAVGHEALTDRALMVAALLAAGPGAVLSHRTAAHLFKLLPSMPQSVEVTLTHRAPRSRAGLRVHQARAIEATTHHGLPVTTPLQTIEQLEHLDRDRARAEALVLQLIPRSADDSAEPTRSELERKLVPALKAAGLPRPLVNHPVGPYIADFFWPSQRLIVETDGWGAHGHRRAFEHDRARDVVLQADGYAVVRFTWRQVMDTTLRVVVQIGQLLVRRGPLAA